MKPTDLPEIKWVRKIDPELDLHWRYLYRLTNEAVSKWTLTVDQYAKDLKQDISLEDIQRSVESGDPAGTVDRIGWTAADEGFKAATTPLFVTALARSGNAEIQRLKLAMRFDLDNPYVFGWIDTHTAELVVQVTGETKKAIAGVIREAFINGDPPRKSAQVIRGLVGLTERDSKAVLNYWRTVASDGNRSAKTAESMADTYGRKLLRRRAETIARHETVSAANQGVLRSYNQAEEQGLMLSTTMKEWIAAADSPRTCLRCLAMDGVKVPIGAPFVTDIGLISGPPLHVLCRCATTAITEIPT